MKKTILTIIATVFCGVSVWAADFYNGGFYYNITSKSEPYEVEVTYQRTDEDNYRNVTKAIIPAKVSYLGKDYAVTSIGYSAFRYSSSLEEVVIPDCITQISEYAFAECINLKSVNIPSSVTRIPDYAFFGCLSLALTDIPENIVSIGAFAFYDCKEMTFTELSDDILSIGESAFFDCDKLTTVNVPNKITTLEDGVFQGCISLASVTIPQSVTHIGRSAFAGCSSLTSILLPESVTNIGSSAFSNCSALTSVNIPSGVTEICQNMFSRCSSLASIAISEGVTSIGDCAFYQCETLTSITIPDGVTDIGEDAFHDCFSLTTINLPQNLTSIKKGTFNNCASLESVDIPFGVTCIGDYAFSYCTALNSVNIPYSVTNIENSVFSYCSSLKSVTLPESLTFISDDTFRSCSNLTSITLPQSVKTIGSFAFYECGKLVSITCYALAPPQISESTFDSDMQICTLRIPCSAKHKIRDAYITAWGDNFFFSEEYMLSFDAVANDVSMGSVTILRMPDCHNNEAIVKATPNKGYRLAVWSNGEETEQATYSIDNETTAVAYFVPDNNDVVRIPNSNVLWTYDSTTKTQTIFGASNSELNDVTDWGAKLPTNRIEHIIVEEGVSSISGSTFQDFTALKDVTLPSSLESIGTAAFSGCNNLESIVIPEGVTSIERYTFANCTKLRDVTFPQSLEIINSDAFIGCSNNKPMTLVFKGYLPSIQPYALSDIHMNPNVVIPCGLLDYYQHCWDLIELNASIAEDFVYSFSVNSTPVEGGVARVIQEPDCGVNAIIEATPFKGYRFVRWSDGSPEANREFEVTQDCNLTAVFEIIGTPISNTKADKVSQKAYKTIIDGRLVIIRDDKMYGITGEVINGK